MAEVPLDSLAHQAGTGGPVADTLSTRRSWCPRPRSASCSPPAAAQSHRLAPTGHPLLGFNPSSQYIVLDYRMHHGTLPLGWVRWYSRSAGRCSWSSSRSCCGCSPTGGCRRAGGAAVGGPRRRRAAGRPGGLRPGWWPSRGTTSASRPAGDLAARPAAWWMPLVRGGDRRDPGQLAGLAGRPDTRRTATPAASAASSSSGSTAARPSSWSAWSSACSSSR